MDFVKQLDKRHFGDYFNIAIANMAIMKTSRPGDTYRGVDEGKERTMHMNEKEMYDLNLKELLFIHTSAALSIYLDAEQKYHEHLNEKGSDGLKEIMQNRYQRFCGLWNLIEAAGLADEYQQWKEREQNQPC